MRSGIEIHEIIWRGSNNRLSLGLEPISLNVWRTIKLSIRDEKTVVMNENSVEVKPFINR